MASVIYQKYTKLFIIFPGYLATLPVNFDPVMQFLTINEYFYKFYSWLLMIALLPILVFIVLYLQPSELPTSIENAPNVFIITGLSVVFIWLTMLFFLNKKIKSVRNGQGLRKKLEKYFELTIVRYSVLTVTGLILAISFQLVRNDWISLLFVAQLLMTALFWPTPRKVCNDLRLRGDEFEMVYHKKDRL
jgi:hypothetical protein